jgi:hypothetical protein
LVTLPGTTAMVSITPAWPNAAAAGAVAEDMRRRAPANCEVRTANKHDPREHGVGGWWVSGCAVLA